MLLRPSRLALVLLLVVLSSAGCRLGAQAPAAVTYPADPDEIAFAFEGPGEAALVVPVLVNGEGPFRMVLDTGATLTCVTEPVAEALALPSARGVAGFGAGVGGSGHLRIVRVDSLRLGRARLDGLQACVLDLSHLAGVGVTVDGLLGLNALRPFTLTLDFGRNVLRLERPGSKD